MDVYIDIYERRIGFMFFFCEELGYVLGEVFKRGCFEFFVFFGNIRGIELGNLRVKLVFVSFSYYILI